MLSTLQCQQMELAHNKKPCSFHQAFHVNCAALPEALLEAELFGYEKGAFTGASRKGKIGLIEMADKGTLFLDEIGELPLSIQSKIFKTRVVIGSRPRVAARSTSDLLIPR